MKVPNISDEPFVLCLLPGELARAVAAGNIERVGNEVWAKDPHCRVVVLSSRPVVHFTREKCEKFLAHDIEVLITRLIPRESKT